MSAADQQRLVEFMENGNAVFMEGANVGQSHNNTEFFNHFGMEYAAPGNQNAISTLSGSEDTFAMNSSYAYPTGDCNYSIDVLDAGLGTVFLTSQSGNGHGVYYNSGTWRTIAISPILGAFNETQNFSTRKFLMMEYIAFLADIEGPDLLAENNELSFYSNTPGADFSDVITIQNNGYLDLEIWDIIIEGDNAFLLDTTAPMIIPSLQTAEIQITFRAMDYGSFSGYISLISNDIDHQEETIFLSGECEQTDENVNDLPSTSVLQSVYPNPFNPQTTFQFSLPSSQAVKLEIFNTRGQLVHTLIDEEFPAGKNSVIWNAPDQSSSVYFYKFSVGSDVQTGKLILLK